MSFCIIFAPIPDQVPFNVISTRQLLQFLIRPTHSSTVCVRAFAPQYWQKNLSCLTFPSLIFLKHLPATRLFTNPFWKTFSTKSGIVLISRCRSIVEPLKRQCLISGENGTVAKFRHWWLCPTQLPANNRNCSKTAKQLAESRRPTSIVLPHRQVKFSLAPENNLSPAADFPNE